MAATSGVEREPGAMQSDIPKTGEFFNDEGAHSIIHDLVLREE